MFGAASSFLFFFFNDTATTEIYTLSLHDALPISRSIILNSPRSPSSPIPCCNLTSLRFNSPSTPARSFPPSTRATSLSHPRSEEHTSELQSQSNLVCRLLLEKKKNIQPPFRAPHA